LRRCRNDKTAAATAATAAATATAAAATATSATATTSASTGRRDQRLQLTRNGQ
jgi:hypothetical protein